MKQSAQWAISSAILFAAAIALVVVALLLGLGYGGLASILFVVMGVQCLLASRKAKRIEDAPLRSGGGAIVAGARDPPRPV